MLPPLVWTPLKAVLRVGLSIVLSSIYQDLVSRLPIEDEEGGRYLRTLAACTIALIVVAGFLPTVSIVVKVLLCQIVFSNRRCWPRKVDLSMPVLSLFVYSVIVERVGGWWTARAWLVVVLWVAYLLTTDPHSPFARRILTILLLKKQKARYQALSRGYIRLQFEKSQFRLLTVLPEGDDDHSIRCELGVYTLKEHPPYEALSWCWGLSGEGNGRVILVDGIERNVSDRLFVALKQLARVKEPRKLWIDALCIDQGNIYELSEQVQIMGQIYGSSKQVLVWLGEVTADSDAAMEHIRAVNEEGCDINQDTANVGAIFNRDWWGRIWVLQEVAMAKSEPLVGCGGHWLLWSYFVHFADCLSSYGQPGVALGPDTAMLLANHNVHLLDKFRETVASGKESLLGSDLRATNRRFKATDVRDKVYALLSLARDVDRRHLVPDYGNWNSQRILGANVLQHCIHVDGNLNLLSFERNLFSMLESDWLTDARRSTYGSDPPTWAPSFDGVINPLTAPPLIDSEPPPYRVSGDRRASASISATLQTLSAEGIHFDVVKDTVAMPLDLTTLTEKMALLLLLNVCDLFTNALAADPLYKFDTFLHRTRYWNHAVDFVRFDARLYLDRTAAAWRTLVLDQSPMRNWDTGQPLVAGMQMPADAAFGRMFDALAHDAPPPPEHAPSAARAAAGWEAPQVRFEYARPFWRRSLEVMANRVPFTTEHGFVGLGPRGTREGDVVAILYGADVPFVLRPVEESRWRVVPGSEERRYALLGDCYVHSIMQGELIELLDGLGGWDGMYGPRFVNFKIL